jgi:thioesterase domain-containing protein
MQVVSRLSRESGRDVALRGLFEQPTPRGLSVIMQQGDADGTYFPLLPLRRTGSQQPLFCIHPGGGVGLCYKGLADLIDPDIPVWALQARGLEANEELHASIEQMVQDYVKAIRTVQAEGPYRILGWSLGGTVAHAIACELELQNEKVSEITLLDTAVWNESWLEVPEEESETAVLAGLADALGVPAEELSDDKDDALGYLARVAASQGLLEDPTQIDLFRRMMKLMQHAPLLLRDHQVGYCAAPIQLFRAGAGTMDDGAEVSFAWASHTSSTVGVTMIDCTHSRMMQPEPVREIAARLKVLWART